MMLEIRELSKNFALHNLGGKIIRGFDSLSFSLAKGSALVLTGPSGTGKSSVLKCIYRAYLPERGSIFFNSTTLGPIDLAHASEQKVLELREGEISYVTQFLKVLPRVPTLEVVAQPLVAAGVNWDEARDCAFSMLCRLGIPKSHFDVSPVTFSGGEQQRVNIARAVIHKPRLLLLDEPTASLDPQSMDVVLQILKELKEEKTSILAVFHDQEIAARIADFFFDMLEREIKPC